MINDGQQFLWRGVITGYLKVDDRLEISEFF